MGQESVAVVTSFYDSFTRRDREAGLALMADDIEWHECEGLPWGGTQHGPVAVVQNVFSPSLKLIDDFQVTPERVVESDGTVAVIHRYTGTGKATGAKLDILGAGFWEVRDGKIVSYWQFVDTAKFLEVVPAEVVTET